MLHPHSVLYPLHIHPRQPTCSVYQAHLADGGEGASHGFVPLTLQRHTRFTGIQAIGVAREWYDLDAIEIFV